MAHPISHDRRLPAFTMIEVLVTISISTVIFLAVSNLMVSFFRINTEIKKDVDLNNEREEIYLELKNFLDEASEVLYPSPPAFSTNGVILLNKPGSPLQPFTLFLPDTDNKLRIYNFALDQDTGAYEPAQPNKELTIGGSTYQLDFIRNRIYKNRPALGPDPAVPCTTSLPPEAACILSGYEQNELAYGAKALAPFIRVLKPTDIRNDNDTALQILSPYEQREYSIDLATLMITTTDRANNARLPYRYSAEGNIIPVEFGTLPTSTDLAGIPVVQSTFDIRNFRYVPNVYGNNARLRIDQIIYTIQNPQNTNQTSTSFLFKLFRK